MNFKLKTLITILFVSVSFYSIAEDVLVDDESTNFRNVASNIPEFGNVWNSLSQSFTSTSTKVKFGFRAFDRDYTSGDTVPNAGMQLIYNLYEGDGLFNDLLLSQTVSFPNFVSVNDSRSIFGDVGFVYADFSEIDLIIGNKYTVEITLPLSSYPLDEGTSSKIAIWTSIIDIYDGGRFYFLPENGSNNDFFKDDDQLFHAIDLNIIKQPENIQIVATSGNSISLNWDNVSNLSNSGGYKIWMSTTENGIYTQIHETNSKTIRAYTQGGLIQQQDYYFKLQTFNNPQNNTNLVVSEFSDPVLARTSITISSSDLELNIVDISVGSSGLKIDAPGVNIKQVVIVIGDGVGYKVNVSNQGPDNTIGAGFIHSPPFGLSNVSWSCSAKDGAICPTTGQQTGDIDLNVDLPVGSTLEFAVTATINNRVSEECCLSNGATVNPNDIVSSSLLITATITPPDQVEDSDISSNATSANIIDTNITKGLWYNPLRNGHGINLERSGSSLILVWYTYLSDGSPVWYLASGVYDESGHWTTSLQQHTWNFSTRSSSSINVGHVWLDFTTDTDVKFSWKLNGINGSEPFQLLASGAPSPTVDYTGLWFPPSDSGWGLTEVTANNLEVSVLYFYDTQGRPIWGLGTNNTNAGSTIALDIFSGFCPSCATVVTTTKPLGTITTNFSNQTTGLLSTDINSNINLSGWQKDVDWQVDAIEIKMLSTPNID